MNMSYELQPKSDNQPEEYFSVREGELPDGEIEFGKKLSPHELLEVASDQISQSLEVIKAAEKSISKQMREHMSRLERLKYRGEPIFAKIRADSGKGIFRKYSLISRFPKVSIENESNNRLMFYEYLVVTPEGFFVIKMKGGRIDGDQNHAMTIEEEDGKQDTKLKLIDKIKKRLQNIRKYDPYFANANLDPEEKIHYLLTQKGHTQQLRLARNELDPSTLRLVPPKKSRLLYKDYELEHLSRYASIIPEINLEDAGKYLEDLLTPIQSDSQHAQGKADELKTKKRPLDSL